MNTPDPSESPQAILGYAQFSPPTNVVTWCRLLAIGMLGLGIERIASIAVFISSVLMGFGGRSQNNLIYIFGSAAVCMIWPALAWYCWVHAPKLAMRVTNGVPTDTSGEATATQSSNDVLCVGLLLLGVYQLSEATPTLATVFVLSFRRIQDLSDLPWRDMLMPMLRLGIGAALIFGNHKVVKQLRKISQPGNQGLAPATQ